jgi:tRNA A-37 threonylcarbamoyl transferase component Bud32
VPDVYFTIREAAYQCLCRIHQAGVEHCDFHLNNILFLSGGVRVIDFSEAVEHDYCSGPDCYELRRAREYLELPPNYASTRPSPVIGYGRLEVAD